MKSIRLKNINIFLVTNPSKDFFYINWLRDDGWTEILGEISYFELFSILRKAK